MQNQSVSDKARNSLTHIGARYSGETGLPARDYPILQQCVANILAALDEGASAAARATELETELQAKGDEIAKLQAELDQVKAELAAKTQDRVNAELQTEDAQTNE